MKKVKRISAVIIAVIFLSSFFAIPVNAVDPVSATVIANSFAQAITAYGAANGISMGFDVSNTNNIGYSVHELWKAFRSGTQSADDYDLLASALFPSLYYKAEKVLAGAATANYVGMHIYSEYAEEFDNFFNWLLSGPGEMVQVDNQFYEWSSSQIGTESSFLPVYSGTFSTLNGYNLITLPVSYQYTSGSSVIEEQYRAVSSNYPSYAYRCLYNGTYTAVVFSVANPVAQRRTYYPNNPNASSSWSNISSTLDSSSGYYWSYATGIKNLDSLPTYEVLSNNYTPSNVFGVDSNNSVVSDNADLGIKAYGDAIIADIPDTADPNYDALQRARDIPLDIPWDETIYGDGTGTLTDAISGAISDAISAILEQIGVLELEDTATPPFPDTPGEVYIPFLPVVVPSFNFSLSGIWHYVREWVSSLGSWFTLVFTVWGILPYVMVVPVYATAVIVIVLGVYKRFFM